jgi:hypothetical protein
VNVARQKALGDAGHVPAGGELRRHEGSDAVKVQQWDGKKWNAIHARGGWWSDKDAHAQAARSILERLRGPERKSACLVMSIPPASQEAGISLERAGSLWTITAALPLPTHPTCRSNIEVIYDPVILVTRRCRYQVPRENH